MAEKAFIVDMKESPARGIWKSSDWTGHWEERAKEEAKKEQAG